MFRPKVSGRTVFGLLIAAPILLATHWGSAWAQGNPPPSVAAPSLMPLPLPVEPPPMPMASFIGPLRKTVADLVPDDRALAMDLIETATDFLAEVRGRETERRAFVESRQGLRDLLAGRLGRFGAEPMVRPVRLEKLPGALDRLGWLLARKFTERYWQIEGEGPPPDVRPCQTPLVTLPGDSMRRCYDFVPPKDWATLDETPSDWLALVMGPGGDPSQGALVGDLTIMDPNIYRRSALILEDLQARIGATDTTEQSLLLEGLSVGNERILSARADGSQWRLDPQMRALIVDMTAYLEQARPVWRAYERLIREDYTALIADTYAEAMGLMQRYGEVERDALTRLRAYYASVTPTQAKARFGATAHHALDPAALEAFTSRHAAIMEQADTLRACVRSLINIVPDSTMMLPLLATEWVRMPPGQPPRGFLFASPLALAPPPAGLSPSPDHAPAGCIFAPGCSFIDPPGGIAVAEAPSGLADMPAFGGFVREACRLVHLSPGGLQRQSAQREDADPDRFVEVSAPESALP